VAGTFDVESLTTDMLGWDSVIEEGAAILAGNFDAKSLASDDATKAILRKLANRKKTIPEILTLITAEEWIEGIKKRKERTSTSPSGRHMGHLKVILAFEPERENEIDPRESEKFYAIMADLLNF
jgi:hypothetical protein